MAEGKDHYRIQLSIIGTADRCERKQCMISELVGQEDANFSSFSTVCQSLQLIVMPESRDLAILLVIDRQADRQADKQADRQMDKTNHLTHKW